MTISVIVPYKDAAPFIGRCIESLIAQPGPFEFLLVNDGSSDEGPEIAAAYKDDRIVLLDNEHKPGVSGARNTGLNHASGEWITFIDADDTMNADVYPMFESATKVGNDVNIYQFNHYRHYSTINKTALKYTNGTGEYNLDSLPVLWCVVWNKLFRASFLKDVRFDETLTFGEDEIFNVECLAKDDRIFCVNGITTTHYFENDRSLSKTRGEKEILKFVEAYIKFIKRHKGEALRTAVCLRLSEQWANLFKDVLTHG